MLFYRLIGYPAFNSGIFSNREVFCAKLDQEPLRRSCLRRRNRLRFGLRQASWWRLVLVGTRPLKEDWLDTFNLYFIHTEQELKENGSW